MEASRAKTRWLVMATGLALGCGGERSPAGAVAVPADRAGEPHADMAATASRPAAVDVVSPSPSAAPAPRAHWRPLPSPIVLHTKIGGEVRVAEGNALDVSARPALITALHGMCYTGEDLCTLLRPIADGRGFLVCPKGNGTCPDGSPDWIIPTAATAVREAVSSAEAALELDDDDVQGRVLLGSSRGAYAACEIIYETPDSSWSGLVLIGASVDPDPEKLRRGGIRRVVLAAPEFDVAAPAMRRAQSKLCRAGLPARFVDLGAHGHGVHPEAPGILAASMGWVMDRADTDECRTIAAAKH